MSLSWKEPKSTGGIELTGYVIERRDIRRTVWLHVDTVKPNITSYCIQNLVEGNEYYFRVFAQNPAGLGHALETLEATVPRGKTGPLYLWNEIQIPYLYLSTLLFSKFVKVWCLITHLHVILPK